MIYLLSFLLLLQPLLADKVGTVLAVYGNALATRRAGEEEILEKNAPVYLHDLIQVDRESIAQIKLLDGTLLNLVAGARYRIEQYSFQHKEQDKFVSELLEGGVRGITGSISKANPNGVEIKTPSSVMGLRGTIFEIFITSEGTYFGCESGEVEIRNQVAKMNLGPRLDQQFGMVAKKDVAPRSFSKRPDVLNLKKFTLPRGCG